MAPIHGVHLVGSSGLPDTSTTFCKCSAALPGRLNRIPDGETGERDYFVHWQAAFFTSVPEVAAESEQNKASVGKSYTAKEVAAGIAKLKAADLKTGYEDAAIESYAIFKRLREEGAIEPGVRFQVCLPTAANVIMFYVQRDFRTAAEPLYEEVSWPSRQEDFRKLLRGPLNAS